MISNFTRFEKKFPKFLASILFGMNAFLFGVNSLGEAISVVRDASREDIIDSRLKFSRPVVKAVKFEKNCTVNQLGKSNYFISALHCIEECLVENKVLKSKTKNGIDVLEVDGVELKKGVGCFSSFPKLQKKRNSSYRLEGEFEVIAVGAKGGIDKDEKARLIEESRVDHVIELEEEGYNGFGGAGDLVLLKANSEVGLQSDVVGICPEKNENSVKNPAKEGLDDGGIDVWSLSYPILFHEQQTYQKSIQLYSLFTPIYSLGKLTHGIGDWEMLNEFGEAEKGIWRRLYSESGIQYANLEIGVGSSGGAVFNGSNQLVGILVSILEIQSNAPYTYGATRMVKKERVWGFINQNLDYIKGCD